MRQRDIPLESVAQAYAPTGFNDRLGFGVSPALLLIDPVLAYVTPGSPLYHDRFADSFAASLRLVAAARRARVPVAITRMEVQPGGVGGGVFHEKLRRNSHCFEPGNPLGSFPPDLIVEPSDIVVAKRFTSAFFGTPLASLLTGMRIDTVVLCGVSTSGCVRASCVDAISHGFRPMVVREAVGDRHPAVQESNLYDINAKFGDVVSEDEILAYFRQTAARQESRT